MLGITVPAVATDAGIERYVVPESPGGAGWADFEQLNHVINVCLRVGDRRDREMTAPYLLGRWHEEGQMVPEVVVARRDGIVGVACYERDTPDVAPTGWVSVSVLPDVRRRGIGAALYGEIERIAAADGRRTLIAEFSSPPQEGPTLTASTGSGEIPAADPGARFALARGYALGQVERISVCPLPLDATRLHELEASVTRRMGDAYRVVSWRGATPDDRVDDLAMLRARMSVDAPIGDVDWPEEIWDAARIRADEARRLDHGADLFVAAAEHLPTGRLVAFSEITVRPSGTTAQQGDTLVVAGHRGHGLGMVLKVANLRALQAARPDITGVMTGNATDNSYMLAINDALGFENFVFNGVWQKAL
jgi:GNAT superfamily N-acetyltransferase